MGLFPRDRNLSRSIDRVELWVRGSDFQKPAEEVQIRLDAFLKLRLPWRSRTSVQLLIDEGFVLVAPAAPGLEPSSEEPKVERRAARNLRHGARVVVMIPPELRLPEVMADPGTLAILYEDQDTLAVDKPAGQVVHPSGKSLTGTLIQDVHARYAGESELPVPIRLCHRIDKETSGIVLFAKGARAHRQIRKQFERHTIEKEYLALVHGAPAADEGSIDLPLGPSHGSQVRLKIAVQAGGWESRTDWRVLERRAAFALLACTPRTGRQHQIRVHLAAIGHAIVGDKLYGDDEQLFLKSTRSELDAHDLAALQLPRQALHNHRMAWIAPSGGGRREVRSPLPAELREFLERAGG
ncbi:MAG: RluA family pseudouridine synthase [Planctomycetes bacterium]|nr:RluA family pseudouridine synthase [Planctomycetota bacterium]